MSIGTLRKVFDPWETRFTRHQINTSKQTATTWINCQQIGVITCYTYVLWSKGVHHCMTSNSEETPLQWPITQQTGIQRTKQYISTSQLGAVVEVFLSQHCLRCSKCPNLYNCPAFVYQREAMELRLVERNVDKGFVLHRCQIRRWLMDKRWFLSFSLLPSNRKKMTMVCGQLLDYCLQKEDGHTSLVGFVCKLVKQSFFLTR